MTAAATAAAATAAAAAAAAAAAGTGHASVVINEASLRRSRDHTALRCRACVRATNVRYVDREERVGGSGVDVATLSTSISTLSRRRAKLQARLFSWARN